MKSNYKALGLYIREVSQRDTELNVTTLLGVSIQKKFIPSIANIIGTDMSTYKIVKRNQFAYGPVTSRNGDKISIALLDNYDRAIISQAYIPFEVIDTNELLPEYLMMWFKRPEFDRYARFMSHGSAREIFSWEEMCNTKLPIPSISTQQIIVKEYNVLINRIAKNNKIIRKLEETAQSLFKQWFVDFEFPDEKNRPYKSSGGAMVKNEFGEIPVGWKQSNINELVICNNDTLSVNDRYENIEYLDISNITNNEINDIQQFDMNDQNLPSRARRKVIHNDVIFSTVRPNLNHFGILKNPNHNMIVSTGFAVLRPVYPNMFSEFIYLTITEEKSLENLQAKAEMSVSTYPSIKPEDLLDIKCCVPSKNLLLKSKPIFESIFDLFDSKNKENKNLWSLSELLLQRLANQTN